jgi:hypothetical protein
VRTLRNALVLVAVAALAASVATSAGATKKPKPKPKKSAAVAFVGTYSGTGSTLVNGSTVTITAKGNGNGTVIGASTISAAGTGDSSQQPCVPFGGTGTITGPGGTINFKAASGATACGDDGGHNFTVKVMLGVTSATGKLANKTGVLRGVGTYSRDDGTWSLKVTGPLK